MAAFGAVALVLLAGHAPKLELRSRVRMGAAALEADGAAIFDWARPTTCAVRLCVDPATGVRGLVMTRACEIGEVILEVPLERVLADADSNVPALASAPPAWAHGLPPHTQLALKLVRERRLGESSEWARYLGSLPQSGPWLPKDMDAAMLAGGRDQQLELQAEGAFCAVHEDFDDAIDAWMTAGEPLAEGEPQSAEGEGQPRASTAAAGGAPPCTAAEFQWAMSMVWTRCLRLDCGPAGVRRLLVPCVDMANHASRPSAFFASAHGAGAAAVRLHAARALAEGEAATLSYGEGSAEYWALHYGFVPDDNPFDHAPLAAADLGLQASEGASDRDGDRDGVGDGEAEWQVRATGVDSALLGAVRRALSHGHAAPPADSDWSERALPPEREALVADAIADACERRALALPMSAAADATALEAADEGAGLLIRLRCARRRLYTRAAERMRAYAAAQRAAGAAGDSAAAERTWTELEGEARAVSAFPELDLLGMEALQSMTLSSSAAPALMFALVAGS